jgi:peroxiredoxin
MTEPQKLKAVMDKDELNWRSFTAQDKVKAEWGDPGTPAYFVIDAKGIIRHKWVGAPGEKTLDSALDKLLQEIER